VVFIAGFNGEMENYSENGGAFNAANAAVAVNEIVN
jgi:hypothetical protein